ncbi:T9SS type A sorting domain-containing protein [Epilithonimonas sp. JDS]|uniref:T9SS type A sorting domain-containing protein n=1 Tax=Epilithonimonas sp. JDS TaxID=2902797 RepID=UPI001E3EF0CC|nr:T9SS type A sorting domain-containing protein [Epilithonimonas sp. JDS]MCD9856709.1 T9SS type A sorting domain-containing protein [Epilithonimonas sp. JDS]
MKKIILFLLLGLITLSQAQLTEVYNFGYTGPASNDFAGETKERIYDGKFFYYYQDNTAKKTFLYYKDTSTSAPVSVKDISASSTNTGLTSIMTYKANEKYLYFTTYTYITSAKGINELWRTDGTESGTVKIKSFEGAPVNFFNIKSAEYSVKSNLAAKNSINGDFMFSSSPTPGTRAVWITNGTPEGTVKLMENTVTNTSTAAYSPIDKVGNKMLFTVLGSTNFWEIWITDGTASGTQFHSQLFATLGMLNGKFYYYATFDDQIANLISYTADGITSNKIPLSLPVNGIDGYNYDNKELYLGSATGKTLFHTTDFSDVKKIADLPQTNTYFLAATDAGLLYAKLLNVNLSDEYTFYFANRNSGVRIVNTGNLFVSSQDTFAFKNTFYSANALKNDTQIYGRELWRMDDLHTELLKDIYPGFLTFSGYTFPNNASPKGFFAHNGEMYFIADQVNGRKLFKFNPDFTFTNGGQDSKWSSPTNWKAGATPMITDNSIIPSSYNVVIDGTAYTRDFQVSSPVNLTNGILNVSGNVALESKITLSNSSLVLNGNISKVSGSNTSNYIVTNENSKVVIENLDASRGAVMIPVGTSNYYNPAIISNNGIADSFSLSVSEGIINADRSLNVSWDISESTAGGSNVALNLGWNQSQEQAGFQRNTAKVGHYKNGVWIEENSGSVSGNNPYSILANGINSFSPFSVLNFATLGDSDFDKDKLSIYPNPTADAVNFSQEITWVHIYDTSGKLLRSFNNTSKINIRDLASGTYIINYLDKNGDVNIDKIIKK